MPAKRQKAWVWFKGGLKGGSWVSGFMAVESEQEEGILVEHSDFKSCRLPEWRVSFKEPDKEASGPTVSEDTIWKYD